MWYANTILGVVSAGLSCAIALCATGCGAAPHAELHPHNGEAYYRIVGGEPVSSWEFPYQALLSLSDTSYCGATVIGASWLVTAQHCIDQASDTQGLHVLAGASRRTSPAEGQRRQVMQVLSYAVSHIPGSHDIALLRVDPFDLSGSRVKPLPLASGDPSSSYYAAPDAGLTKAGTDAWVSGWGATEASASSGPDQLRAARVSIVDHQSAADAWIEMDIPNMQGVSYNRHVMLAAGGDGEKDTCQGDSGGPLVVERSTSCGSTERVLAGVVSLGYRCGEPGMPAWYARISSYRDWIVDTTGIDYVTTNPADAVGAEAEECITRVGSNADATSVQVVGRNGLGCTAARSSYSCLFAVAVLFLGGALRRASAQSGRGLSA